MEGLGLAFLFDKAGNGFIHDFVSLLHQQFIQRAAGFVVLNHFSSDVERISQVTFQKNHFPRSRVSLSCRTTLDLNFFRSRRRKEGNKNVHTSIPSGNVIPAHEIDAATERTRAEGDGPGGSRSSHHIVFVLCLLIKNVIVANLHLLRVQKLIDEHSSLKEHDHCAFGIDFVADLLRDSQKPLSFCRKNANVRGRIELSARRAVHRRRIRQSLDSVVINNLFLNIGQPQGPCHSQDCIEFMWQVGIGE